MQTMDQCLQKFYDDGKITAQEAYLKANEKKRFQPLVEKEESAVRMAAQAAAMGEKQKSPF
jgi:Tfp pilus assembly ATPase PilU